MKTDVETFNGVDCLRLYQDWINHMSDSIDIVSINTLNTTTIFVTYRREKGFLEF